MARIGTYDKLNIPTTLAVAFVAFCTVCALSPYAAAQDFGIFKVPTFNAEWTRFLRVVGPIMVLLSVVGFLPFWHKEPKDRETPQYVLRHTPDLTLPSGSRFTDAQFDTYRDIWVSLQDLRQDGEELWEKPTKAHLRRFARRLQDARRKVAAGAIFFQESDYNELLTLLQQLGLFRDGKQDLIEYLEAHPEVRAEGDSDLDPYVAEQIQENQRRLTDYNRLLDRLRETYHHRLAGQRDTV